MTGAETPQVQIGQLIAISLDYGPHAFGHTPIRVRVEQHCAGVAHETVGPSRDDDGTAQAGDRTCMPSAAEKAAERQADNNQHRNCRIRQDVNNGSTHPIIVAMRRTVGVVMLLELDRMAVGTMLERDIDRERMRFGNSFSKNRDSRHAPPAQ